MPRTVTLELYAPDGRPLGALPPYEVAVPWWQETLPVVEGARAAYGIEVSVLRLVAGCGDDVVYAAVLRSTAAQLPLTPDAHLDEPDPNRPIWARPGGLDRIVDWAAQTLADRGRPPIGPPVQIRAWNLSSILRVPTADGPVWCKSVPSFFGHEGPVIAALATVAPAGLLPPLLGHDPVTRTVLLDDVAGADAYDADLPTRLAMVDRLVALQADTTERVETLLGLGAPDWRAPALARALRGLVRRPDVVELLAAGTMTALRDLIDTLPHRFAALARCGLPDTLVHGDAHPGNWRHDRATGALTLLDWGDTGVGHPMLDLAAITERVEDPVLRRTVTDRFVGRWMRLAPTADPARAAVLVEPVAALRQALIYRTFLDGIERTERVYHHDDVARWLDRAVSVASAGAEATG